MTTVRLFIASFLLLTIQSIFAQDETLPRPNTSKKPSLAMTNSIERFKNTDFMQRFAELKNQVEGDAEDFIAERNRYKSSDVRKVQMAYERTATKFNQVLLDIKGDFMDKEKIKMINKFPQMYSDGLTSKIHDLDRFYRENLLYTLTTVTQKDGSAILMVLIELIKASSELSSYFKDIKHDKQAMSEEYINQNLITPMRLKSWQQIFSDTPIREGGNNGNQNGNGNGNQNDNGNGNQNDNGNGNQNDNGNGNQNDNGNGNQNDNGNGNSNQNGNDSGNNTPPQVKKRPTKIPSQHPPKNNDNQGDTPATGVEMDNDSAIQGIKVNKQPTQKPAQAPTKKNN